MEPTTLFYEKERNAVISKNRSKFLWKYLVKYKRLFTQLILGLFIGSVLFSKTHVGNNRFEKTNRIDFLKAQKKYLMNMNGYIQMETGIDLSDGQPAKVMRYDLIECDYN